MTNSKKLYFELELIDKLVFKPCGLKLTSVETELEGQEYFAHNVQVGKQNVKFRTAKTTPKKTGQFVTIWKRNERGITEPFAVSDDIDLYLIATRKDINFGLFIFHKTVLSANGILSSKTKRGKRGIRVYPVWDLTMNNQANKTQQWQAKYFLDLSDNITIDLERAKYLLQLNDLHKKLQRTSQLNAHSSR